MNRPGGRGGWGRCAMIVVGLVLSLGSGAHAQRRAPSAEQAAKDKEAREHYNQGILHYDLGEIDQAIAEFKQAYAISAVPGLLFNIAQAYRYKKDYEQALHFYRTYLRLQPKAGNRDEVEERMAELEKLVEESKKAQAGRPHGIIPPGEKSPTDHEPPGRPAQVPPPAGDEPRPAVTTPPAPPPIEV